MMETNFKQMAQTTPFSPEFKMSDYCAAIQSLDRASRNYAKEYDEDPHSADCLDAQELVLTISLHLGRHEPLPQELIRETIRRQ